MEFGAILDWHFRRYPLWRAEDIYKLIYQGVFGPSHLEADPEGLAIRLKEELAGLGKRCLAIEETEPVDPDGVLVRVNLMAVADSAPRQKSLLEALVVTINEFVPEPEKLESRLGWAQRWCEKNLPLEVIRLKKLTGERPSPPVHSEVYQRVYRPAYRVIFSRFLPF